MKARVQKTVRKPSHAGAAKARAPKRMTGEERSRQIVRVAAGLFAKKGFKGTTTREIARKAGISEAVIFKHFSCKEELYKAIIDFCCADQSGQSRLMAGLQGKQGREVFLSVASFLLDEHENNPAFLRIFTYSALEQQSLSELFIQTMGAQLLEFLEGHIRELAKEGSFRSIDPAICARAFLGMVIHYVTAQELYGFKRRFSRSNRTVAETFVDIFFEGMRRR